MRVLFPENARVKLRLMADICCIKSGKFAHLFCSIIFWGILPTACCHQGQCSGYALCEGLQKHRRVRRSTSKEAQSIWVKNSTFLLLGAWHEPFPWQKRIIGVGCFSMLPLIQGSLWFQGRSLCLWDTEPCLLCVSGEEEGNEEVVNCCKYSQCEGLEWCGRLKRSLGQWKTTERSSWIREDVQLRL